MSLILSPTRLHMLCQICFYFYNLFFLIRNSPRSSEEPSYNKNKSFPTIALRTILLTAPPLWCMPCQKSNSYINPYAIRNPFFTKDTFHRTSPSINTYIRINFTKYRRIPCSHLHRIGYHLTTRISMPTIYLWLKGPRTFRLFSRRHLL